MPSTTAQMLANTQPNNNLSQILGAVSERGNNNAANALLGQLNESGPDRGVPSMGAVFNDPNFQRLEQRDPERANYFMAKRQAIGAALGAEDEASQIAFFTDMRNVKRRLEAGQLTEAMGILLNRRAAGNQISNFNPEDTDRILNKLQNEDFDGAMLDLNFAMDTAADAKYPGFEAGEDFTLANNAVRFDSAGNEIASNISAPSGDSGFSLSRGQQRFDPSGNLVAENSSPDEIGGLADQRARRIEEYQRLFSMSVEEATRKVDTEIRMDDNGNLIGFDPISGSGSLVNVDTGTEPPVISPPSGTSVEDLAFDPGKGTGFGASFLGLWNSTAGQIPFVPEALETEESAQNLRLLTRDAIRALGSSGRPPVVEQERIAALIPQAMAWTQNPEIARFQMTNFVDLMMNQYLDDLRYSGNKRNPKAVRDTSTARANNIQSIIRRVLTPEASEGMFSSLNRVEGEMGEIQNMPFAELQSLEASKLSDAQLDAYIERLKAGDN